MTLRQAVEEFNKVFDSKKDFIEEKDDFYCGITNDIERRAQEHNAEILYYVKAKSLEEAKELEQALHDEGYDTGVQLGNGQDDSVYVYMYEKIPGVTEEQKEEMVKESAEKFDRKG